MGGNQKVRFGNVMSEMPIRPPQGHNGTATRSLSSTERIWFLKNIISLVKNTGCTLLHTENTLLTQ